jgi:putative endonuclease
MYFVYILKSKNANKSYVGFTDNVTKRLIEHNSGKANYTKKYMPWEILAIEEYKTREEAVTREKYLKSASGRRLVLKKIFKN